ncbi:MAG: hypothetical protein ACYTHJ_12930 [Planctomycetota bacterium]|jgi:hypothetical protein
MVAMLLFSMPLFAAAPDAPDVPFPFADRNIPALYLDPIDGLTTATYRAPQVTGVPLGVTLRFCQDLCDPNGDPQLGQLNVEWTNATETQCQGGFSFAECSIRDLGQQIVSVQVSTQSGELLWENNITLIPVPVQIEDVQIQAYWISVPEVDLDEESSNAMTMAYYFGGSIADLQYPESTVAYRSWESRYVEVPRYITSIDRAVTIDLLVEPQQLLPLMELRADGRGVALGTLKHGFYDTGVHILEAGPPGAPVALELDTYRTIITSHINAQDFVYDGSPTLFEAVTDPPGYEDYIRWISSTQWGTAQPVLGYGSTFEVTFEDTLGDHGRWLGVRADNAIYSVHYDSWHGGQRRKGTLGGSTDQL